MSCFDPRLIRCSVSPTGELVYRMSGKANFSDPHDFGSISDLSGEGSSYMFAVPCGKCVGCQIDYSHEWADRMCVELQDNPSAVFLTLTYNNLHLPLSDHGYPTLSKDDLQLFWKRLRKAFPERRIRYFVAGEYGPKTYRPHYHAIVYGLGLSDFHDLLQHGYNELRQPYFTSAKLESLWGNGFILFSDVNYKTCAYVARYVMKKHSKSSDFIKSRGILPEFNLSSRRPGIGLASAVDYVTSGHTYFSLDGRDGVHQMMLPKSFIKHCKRNADKLGIDVDFLNDLCYNRSTDSRERLLSNLDMRGVSFFDFLRSNEKKLSDRIKILPERSRPDETTQSC